MLSRAPLLLTLVCSAVCSCKPQPPPPIPVVEVPGAQNAPVIAEPEASTDPTPKAPAAEAGEISWETSEEVARARSKSRKAPLVVFVTADWATPAVQMDRTTWKDPRVVRLARSFILLRLDVSSTDANAQAKADSFNLSVMPSTLLLDDAGNEVGRLEGYADPDAMLASMEEALAGH